MERDLAYFEQHPEEFEQLSDEDRMTLANGDPVLGEISGESPDAASDAGEPEDSAREESVEQQAGAESVVLAKDGKHTIPFEELQRARDAAAFWQAKAEQAQAGVAQQQQDPAPHADLKDLRRQLREATLLEEDDKIEALESQIDAELVRVAREEAAAQFAAYQHQVAAAAEQREIEETARTLVAKYPALDHNGPEANAEAIVMVQSLSSVYAQTKPPAAALSAAVDRVVSLLGLGKPEPSNAEAKAAQVIADAKAKVRIPSSLSSIPAAPTPPSDELSAVAQMPVQQMQDRMMDMPRDKILALLART